jgi:hypothetical protein
MHARVIGYNSEKGNPGTIPPVWSQLAIRGEDLKKNP